MPERIVDKYRPIYRKKFMEQTLKHALPNAQIRTEAFLRPKERAAGELEGFPGVEIIVSYDATDDPDILAANTAMCDPETGNLTGIITVSPILCRPTKKAGWELLKAVLAEEWIEVMLKIRDGDTSMAKTVAGKEKLVLLFSKLKRPVLWQDTPDEYQKMAFAMRKLLVSEYSLRELAHTKLNTNFNELRKLADDDPNRAMQLLHDFAEMFSAEWQVDIDLVWDRIQEVMFGPPLN